MLEEPEITSVRGFEEYYAKQQNGFDEETEAIADWSAKGERLAGFIKTIEAQTKSAA